MKAGVRRAFLSGGRKSICTSRRKELRVVFELDETLSG